MGMDCSLIGYNRFLPINKMFEIEDGNIIFTDDWII
jgi:hypothetical protein